MAPAETPQEKPEEAPPNTTTATTTTATTSPRKRRRRAPTTGAADDCFACQDRHRKCDRKRPYCTQCLEYGKDCSGYKTALTWNIGVASRGKLRGLSLPIAKSKKVDPDPDAKPTKKRSTSNPSKGTGPTPSQWPLQNPPPTERVPSFTGPVASPTDVVMMDGASGTSPMLPPSNLTWPRSLQRSHHSTTRQLKRVRSQSLRPLDVPTYRATRAHGLEGMPMSAHALGGYADPSFGITVESSPTASSFAGFEPGYEKFHNSSTTSVALSESPAQGNFFTGSESFGLPRDNMSSSLSSDSTSRSSRDYNTGTVGGDESGFLADPIVAHTLDNIISSHHPAIHDIVLSDFSNDFTCSPVNASFRLQNSHQPVDLVPDDVGAHSPSTISRSLPALPIEKNLDIEYLFQNFTKFICPVIVALDGPSNLYKSHITRLAIESGMLLHAIAALSLIHIQQQRRSDNHTLVTKSRNIVPAGELSSMEEVRYSLRALSDRLRDPIKIIDDSTIATLLILGLYQIYSIGVNKFKAQLAVVKKMMAFRPTGGDDLNNKKAVSWLTLTFTWLESMTDHDHGNVIEDAGIHGDQENLTGCDPRLFRMIMRLGRLNFLARTIEFEKSTVEIDSLPPAAESPHEYYSMPYSSTSEQSTPFVSLPTRYKSKTRSQQFWHEFHFLRARIEAFQPTPSPSSSSFSLHVSEFFRSTALIYLARFSRQTQISTWVKQAICHINMIDTDIWLSWPLWKGARIPGAGARVEVARKRSGRFFPTECVYVLERLYRDDEEPSINPRKEDGIMHIATNNTPILLSPQPVNPTWGFDPEAGHRFFSWKKDAHHGDVGMGRGALMVI